MNEAIKIPFNKPTLIGRELFYISQVILSGRSAGDAGFTRRCHTLLEEALGVPRVLLTTSCTDALEMAALLLQIEPGDEVIVPSFTFVSTVNAFVLRGARPVFIDVRKDTLNLDESLLEAAITPRTKAIVPVHYAGVGCEMDVIGKVASRNGIPVVEDNAHGLFGKYRGRFSERSARLRPRVFTKPRISSVEKAAPSSSTTPATGAGRNRARERHQSEPFLSGRSGQVQLGRYRVEFSSLRHPGRLSLRPTASMGKIKAGAGGSGSTTRITCAIGRMRTRSACRSFLGTANSPTTCSTCCFRRSKRGRD